MWDQNVNRATLYLRHFREPIKARRCHSKIKFRRDLWTHSEITWDFFLSHVTLIFPQSKTSSLFGIHFKIKITA